MAGSYSCCRLREGRQRRQQNSNLIENAPVRKHWEWEGEKQDKRQTHHRLLLCVICEWGMVVAGTYSLCRLREGPQRQKQNSSLIENALVRKHWEWEGGKQDKRQTLHRLLLSGILERGIQRWALIPFIDGWRAINTCNNIAIELKIHP